MSVKLEDSAISSLTIENATVNVTKGAPKEGACQTDPILMLDAPCDSMERGETGTQTEASEQLGEEERSGVRISEEVIVRMLEALSESGRSRKIYERLNTLHDTTRVHLTTMRTIPIMPPPTASIIDIVAGSADRAVILLGEVMHETWCAHECGLRVINRRTISSVLLPTCPTSAGFLERDLIAVGTVGGEIYNALCFDKVSNQLFSAPVSSLYVPSSGSLVAVSIDGHIRLCALKGAELAVTKSLEVTVSALPRSIRATRSTESEARIGLVSVSGTDKEMCIVSETGGIWTTSLTTLSLQSIPAYPQPLASVIFRPPHLILHGDDGRVHVCTISGERVDSLPNRARKVVVSPDGLLIALSATSATPSIAFHDLIKRRMIIEIETTTPLLSIAVKGRDGLLTVAEDAQIVEYDVTRV
ncbi:hypothetical protein PFISCL1PPCAC_18021 [Pristionchus fissidentatus]|uniref:WD40 domain-containing protein n=1 Tax=Pristionchus fissidentatus TaxID=1538716 RepID=A0AAV5WA72_9BILA|nr:hypothetical protein PFISCL1PPCAC_18021 [Pristionchus fissidentatus]